MFPPSRGPHTRIATALVLSAALTVAGSLTLADSAAAAPASSHSATRLLASDNMNRYVSVGLGRAGRGGRYAVSSARGARVKHHRAVLGPVAAGHQVAAWLPRVHVYNARVRTTFRLAHHRGLGGGEYFAIGLRRVSPGCAYLAKVHLAPGRGVFVGLSRVRGGHEQMLGTERRVLPASAMHGWLSVQGQAVGSSPVQLAVRVWRAGHTKPAHDQLTYSDQGSARLRRTGSVAFQSYLSRSASARSVVEFRQVRVWRQALRSTSPKPGQPTPPTSTPPTSTPPTSTPPTSTPPTSTPPTSTPPTSTPPTSTPPTSAPPTSTPPTSTAADAGSVAPGQASYPIPGGAVFVSPSGNDSAAGTQGNPLRTLGKAMTVAPSGGTIVLRAGVYHETVQDFSKPLTVQNFPGEAVWLDGSTAVTGWTQQGSTWVHTGWTAQFSSVPSYTGTVSNDPYWSFVNAAHPMAAHPDQMWIDGTPLSQVGSASDVGPGRFYADYADNELVVGSDPTSRETRASDLGLALTTYASDFTVRGIGVRRYATAVNQFGALRLLGKRDAAQNVISTENATTGIMLGAAAPTIDHVTVTNNGMLGLTGTYVDGITVDGLLSQGNNTEGFSNAPVSGGMKIARTRGVTVRNSKFLNNTGPGTWFDESVYDANVIGNVMSGNAGHGLSYEISSTALIADNIVQNNGGDGFKINDSDHVRIWNNTILNNGRDIEVVQDARRGAHMSDAGHNPHVAQPDATEPWTITDDSVMNNVLTPAGGAYQLYVRDYSGQYAADDINLQLSGNQFLRGTSGAMIVWGNATGNPRVFTTIGAFASATGQGSANTDVTANQQVLGNPGGMPLPADVASMIGQSTGTRHLGAF